MKHDVTNGNDMISLVNEGKSPSQPIFVNSGLFLMQQVVFWNKI